MARKRKNDENLRPPKTSEEARERGRAGGIASGEARRKKKNMRQMAKILMEMPVGETQQKKLEALGVPADEATYQMAVLVSMLQESLKGNVKAATFVRDTFLGDMAVEVRREEIRQRKHESEDRLAFERERFEFQKDHGAAQSADGLLADLINDLQGSRGNGGGVDDSSAAATEATEAAVCGESEPLGARGGGACRNRWGTGAPGKPTGAAGTKGPGGAPTPPAGG